MLCSDPEYLQYRFIARTFILCALGSQNFTELTKDDRQESDGGSEPCYVQVRRGRLWGGLASPAGGHQCGTLLIAYKKPKARNCNNPDAEDKDVQCLLQGWTVHKH